MFNLISKKTNMNKTKGSTEKVMDAIVANPNSDNKKLIKKTGLSRETIRLTVKKLMAEGKIVAGDVTGKAMTFIVNKGKTTAKVITNVVITKPIVKIAVKSKNTEIEKTVSKSSANNDRTKIMLNGQEYTKGKAVLAVVQGIVAKNPNITVPELHAIFPANTHRKYKVADFYSEAIKKCQKQKRYFTREDQLIKLMDGSIIAVCSDWGAGNMDNVIRRAKQAGFTLTFVKG